MMLHNFGIVRATASMLQRESCERMLQRELHVTFVGALSVAVHPVAVNVASLAIVVTLRKGCDASFLV